MLFTNHLSILWRCVTLFFTYIVESKKSDHDGGLADDFGNPG